ncbi:type IV secretion system DNA-binding domain-containing protein [Kitasatospora sp. NBC_01287]|uniref:type IV secretion system DNA-binding domain-containing protein n=1 Tax=Kitasatospora sp. NBC_01287 TaxID=2903573 RepID=UPI0022529384|nr:type IV secretion system DNA-binding domain-containing protein [Kitasatospora sp. NBC_01287]MCX4750597.1 type IV secretion system DNA-binding domain-containing protein [Kitasatospora sp. NBC_01287]
MSAPTPGGPLGNLLLDRATWWESGLKAVASIGSAQWVVLLSSTAGAAAAFCTARRALHHRQQTRLTEGGTVLTVLCPPKVDPAAAAALWSHLVGLLRPWYRRLFEGQPHLAFEYHFTTDGLTVRLWAPATVPQTLLRRAVEAAWHGAHAQPEQLPVQLAKQNQRFTAGGTLRLGRPEILPLRTDHNTDPLRALLGAGLALHHGEHITVSVLARPATGRRVRRAKYQLRSLRSGTGSPSRAGRLLDLLTHQPSRTTLTAHSPEQSTELRAALAKSVGPQWETAIRYAVTTPIRAIPAEPGRDGEATEQALALARARARGRAHAIASAFAVHSGRNFYTRRRLLHPAQQLAARHFPRRGDLLSIPELAAIAHLPHDPDAPGVQRAGARSIPPTAAIPLPGPSVKPLGVADTGTSRPVGISVPDGRHHLHIIGATGSGKSTLMATMVLADATAGRGALVVDPKGDLINDLLARLPESALGRTVLIDPDDHAHPPRLNVLEGADPGVVVDNLVGIFRRIFTAFWGPRTDDVMRAACLTLMTSRTAGPTVTLADIPRLLTEPAYRRRTTAGVDDRVLLGFWTWYEQLSEPARAAATGPLMNKLRAFLLRPFVQHAIASGPSTFDLADVLDGGIALIRLPKGVLGEETARLLGSFVVAKTWQAASSRATAREQGRRDAALYLDECHNFLTLPYPLEDMLAEARGYRLSLVLAHQHLAQLPHDLREGISANARSKIVFNASPEDARDLERHIAPHLAAHDLSHLGAYQAAARLVTSAANAPAFTLRTTPLPEPVPGRATAIRRSSRTTYGPKTTHRK